MANFDNTMPPAGLNPDESQDQLRQRLLRMPPAALQPRSPAPTPVTMPPAPVNQPASAPAPAPSTMPPGPVPAAAAPAQAPELHGWRKALDAIGSIFPAGRAVEQAIPGTPQNFDMKQAMQAARTGKSQTLEEQRQRIEEGNQRIAQEPAAADLNRRNIESEIKAREAQKPLAPHDVVKDYSDALASGDEKKAAELAPKVQQFIQATQKPAKEPVANDKDKDIADYMEANKLPDNAANREKARGAIAQRSKTEVSGNDAKDIADAIARGEQPPTTTGLYRNAAAVRAELGRMGYNLAQAESDWHATQKHLATLNGQQQERLRQAVSFTGDSLSIIEDLYNQWQKVGKTSEWKMFNKASLGAAKQLPGEPGNIAHRLEAQISDLTSELGTVYKGGNSSTDESLKLAEKNLEGDWNEKTFKDSIAQIRKNLEIRQNSIKHSQPAGVSENSPYTPQSEKGGGKSWNAATGKYE